MMENKKEKKPAVAVLVPCYNEETTIENVVADFRKEIPDASIYVYDNNSSDGTADVAAKAGAIVRTEPLQGKGNVVRRMFADIEADIYIMVDGDATYDSASANRLIERIGSGYDMVNAARDSTAQDAYRKGHRFGNWMLTSLVGTFFGSQTTDMLSGYKAFSRRFVKSFPSMSPGFEIETELMIHAMEMKAAIDEIRTPYMERPEGSASKLSTFKDGWRILKAIGYFVKNEKPLRFFSVLSGLLAIISILIGIPIMATYFETGMVPRLPTAILSAFVMLTAILSLFTGLILDTVTLSRKEAKRLIYLNTPATHLKNATK